MNITLILISLSTAFQVSGFSSIPVLIHWIAPQTHISICLCQLSSDCWMRNQNSHNPSYPSKGGGCRVRMSTQILSTICLSFLMILSVKQVKGLLERQISSMPQLQLKLTKREPFLSLTMIHQMKFGCKRKIWYTQYFNSL